MMAMTTDYASAVGNPDGALRKIAEAGFEAVHWCHQWNTDFLYGKPELDAIDRCLTEYDLTMHDFHASAGVEKNWGSVFEHERLAGVELVKNRIDMAERFDCGAIIMHLPPEVYKADDHEEHFDNLRKSLDELELYAMARHVRIAIENSHDDNFDLLEKCFNCYANDFLGLCYDTGHGNIARNGLDRLSDNLNRLYVLHLHDNDASDTTRFDPKRDLHRNLFTGTVDWGRLAELIARSKYDREAMTIETAVRNEDIEDEKVFLAQVYDAGVRFESMVQEARGS